ncbi:flagellar basal body P-ring biosynthesis protein [Mycolicibacterium chubuense NBB4]|uniref:Flagellar basal body P-ring biosynthesis protein n=1 Tax=Mycolicibacterium chubuense (strain NBB4) TaxID=710421 RepID=I4BNT7_MYCCN|nr:SAF domain-containing protein [Mycolicibacterium chubuense]AFM18944.1 flagellar basal body P-ring biosynthesis protein [Mycolicibacterium chubuense NBB4]
MGESLDPSPWSRLTRALRPDWSRTVAARRILAGALVVLAAAAALRDDPRDAQSDVVVAVRDLAPGVELTADDIGVQTRAAPTIPEGAATQLDAVVGRTLAGATRRGEVLTDVRLLGPRLAGSAAGPDARIVALPLADAALLDLVRPGDVVDIVAAPQSADDEAQTRVIATNAVVVLVSQKDSGIASRGGNRVVLVALPAAAAKTVAGAALVQAVTLTLH